MGTYDSFADAIGALGRAVVEVCQVDRSGLSGSEQTMNTLSTVDEWIAYAHGTDYWRTWNQILEVLCQYGENYDVERHVSPHSDESVFVQNVLIGFSGREQQVCWLSVEYFETGQLHIWAEYRDPVTGSPEVLCDDLCPLIDIGDISRTITCLEVTSLAHELGSCAAVLDYYMTTHTGWYTQKEWSEIRGVNRQTVNDRNREARQGLGQ